MNGVDPVPIFALLSGLCCCFFFMIGLGYLAFRLLTKRQSSTGPSARLTDRPTVSKVSNRVAQYGNIVSSVTDDGFYLFNNFLTPGTMIQYRYRGPAGWITRSVPYQPGPQGHYVYVGSLPQEVHVVDVVPLDSRDDRDDDPDNTIVSSNPMFIPPANSRGGENTPQLPPSMIQTMGEEYPAAY